jgi:F-type H+-transporting ATPase subunit a
MAVNIEYVYKFVLKILKRQAGKPGLALFPFLFTLFLFILMLNLLSLMPFGIAVTSHIVVILWLTVTVCTSIFVLGLLKHNIFFLQFFIPECPFVLLFLLIPIELFSYGIRMFSLAIRLAANILAGHTLVHIAASFVCFCVSTNFFLFFFVFPLLLILVLEFGVAFLQAYVFVILVSIYISDSLSSPRH